MIRAIRVFRAIRVTSSTCQRPYRPETVGEFGVVCVRVRLRDTDCERVGEMCVRLRQYARPVLASELWVVDSMHVHLRVLCV